MFLRTSNIILTGFAAAFLVGCGASDDRASASNDGDVIACALDGSTDFQKICDVERATVDGQLELLVRHPDGGFRKFIVVSDGRGLVTADGSEEAQSVIVDGDLIEVAVGTDRYRFPFTAKPKAGDGDTN